MAKKSGHHVFDSDTIKRRIAKGNPGMGQPGSGSGGESRLSPSDQKSAGSMLKTNIKPKGMNAAAVKRLGKGYRR